MFCFDRSNSDRVNFDVNIRFPWLLVNSEDLFSTTHGFDGATCDNQVSRCANGRA